jgi:hypothetical protein
MSVESVYGNTVVYSITKRSPESSVMEQYSGLYAGPEYRDVQGGSG